MKSNNYYIDQILIFIDGEKTETITITGLNYDPNIVKSSAIGRAREVYPDSRIAAVILSHRDMTYEEYKDITGQTPPWFIDAS